MLTIGDNLGVNLAITFIDTKDWLLVSAPVFFGYLTPWSFCPKVAFVYLYFTLKLLEFLQLVEIDSSPNEVTISIDSISVYLKEFRGLGSGEIKTEALKNLFSPIFA